MNDRPDSGLRAIELSAIKQADARLPYPELFDRSERTFAATFAQFGDLSYFTPVQRVGAYMDYSQRLQKRHLTDLIAYLKATKQPPKALDETAALTDVGLTEFLECCLFHGSMSLEDQQSIPVPGESERSKTAEQEDALYRVYDFPFCALDDQSQFKYNAVWSRQLLKQVQLSTYRFLKYVDSGDYIKSEEVSKFRKEWMQRAIELLPERLLRRFSREAKVIFQEVFASYVRAMRQAMLEYILRSPDERKRLHILMLPRPRQTAAERHVKEGGYSVVRFAGHHQRRQEADGKLKQSLIAYNVATQALQGWWQDFEHFTLVDLRNLGHFIEERHPQKRGAALYAMELPQFFKFQSAYQQKVRSLLRHVWHRGCVLLIKRFKLLREPSQEDDQAAKSGTNGRAARGKWTFRGYKEAQEEKTERRWVDESVLREVHQFTYDRDMSPLQRYYFRAASLHQNVPVSYFLNEEGLESTDILSMDALLPRMSLQELPDVRDCSAYRAYARDIGTTLDLGVNGYKELSKDQRGELKFAATQIMKQQLKETIDRSVSSLRNFLVGFLTLD